MSAKLHAAMSAVSGHMEKIAATVFKPGMRLTFIARDPDNPEADFLMSDDDLPAVAELLQRSLQRKDTS